MAAEMIIMHNFFLRIINSVYLQCVNVERSAADIPSFVAFARAWASSLHDHHTAEESYVFPDIEKITGIEGLMAGNVEQHHGFEEGVHAYAAYLDAVQEGKEKYDGQKLSDIIDGFMPVLRQHLEEEVDTLKDLEKFEDKTDWAAWTKKVKATILEKGRTKDGMVCL